MSKVTSWLEVASVRDLEPNTGYESDVEIEGEAVGIFQIGGDYYALGPCTHEQGPLSQGIIQDGTVRCPWHSAVFDIRNGNCLSGPTACRIDGSVLSGEIAETHLLPKCTVFETKVKDGKVFIRLPLRTPLHE